MRDRRRQLEHPGKGCLHAAAGFLEAFRYALEIFIRCAAARPRDPMNNFVGDIPIHKMYQNVSGIGQTFSMPFFELPEFTSLVSHIRKLEEEETQGILTLA